MISKLIGQGGKFLLDLIVRALTFFRINPNIITFAGVIISFFAAWDLGHGRFTRGGLILILGIIGILCCFLFGIPAWVMGSSDLKEIRAGRMDRSGQGLTQAGMVIGIVATVLGGLGIVIQIIMFAAAGMH